MQLTAVSRRELFAIGLILLTAVTLRLYRLSSLPGGLNGDEVFNAIDALRVGTEHWPVFFEGNNGREALFLYLAAASLRLLGQTVFALRLPAALLGTGSVWLAWRLGRSLFNRRVGLLSAALIAVSLWPVMESRWALRAVSLTFMTALTVYLLDQGFRRKSGWYWLAGGVAMGLTLYTYIPSRLLPAVILVWIGWLFWTRREETRSQWRQMAVAFITALIVFLPFAWYIWQFPDKVNQRANSMTVALDLATKQGDWGALAASVWGVIRMFSLRGDVDWRYHVSGMPVFDPLTSLFFYIGVALCLWLAFSRKGGRDRPSYALLLLWAGAMLVPNAILEANSSFLRAAGAIVPIYLITAVGFDGAATWLHGRFPKIVTDKVVTAVVLSGLLLTLAVTCHRYVNIWHNQADVRRIYQADLAEIGRFLNQNPPPQGTRVYLADSYVVDIAPRTFAYFSNYPVDWFSINDSFALGNGREPLWVFVGVNETLPPEFASKLGLAEGTVYPFANGDPAFTLYQINPEEAVWPPQQPMDLDFADNPRLIGYDLAPELYRGETIPLFLHWQIPPERTHLPNQIVFAKAQLVDGVGNVWSEVESLLGYPQESWRTDDRFVQMLSLEMPDAMPPGEAHLRVSLRDFAGQPIGMAGENESAGFVVRSRPLTDFTLTPEMPLFDDTLALRDTIFSSQLMPGLDIDIGLDWVAVQRPSIDYKVQFQLWYAGEEAPFLTQTAAIWPDVYPPTQWQAGEAVRSLHRLIIPADMPLGEKPELRLQLLDPATGTAVPLTQGDNKLADMTLVTRDYSYEVPPISQPQNAQFGDSIRLLGYDLADDTVQPGETLRLTLYWQALETPPGHYTVFNHIAALDGRIVAQLDGLPGGTLTGTWLPGEIIVDEREILLGADVGDGRYALRVGLYDAGMGERLPVIMDDQAQINDQLVLTEIEIEP
ncbi:MAG: glycosyltransferase family 39 protein [Chloroflexi bacterium]|nr:glycosyltransferase family 39 protein [Chloroflexota bacterium]